MGKNGANRALVSQVKDCRAFCGDKALEEQNARQSLSMNEDGARAGLQVKCMFGGRASRAHITPKSNT